MGLGKYEEKYEIEHKRRNKMKRCIVAIILMLTLVLTTTVQPTLAYSVPVYWAGNVQGNTYGVKADITTPTSRSNTQAGLIASWVDVSQGTSDPNVNYWVQTGWVQYQNFLYAQAYTEITENNDYHDIENRGVQNWGTSKNYAVRWVYGAVGWWVIYIDNSLITMVDDDSLPTPPTNGYVLGEVQNSTTANLFTNFNNVQYFDANYNWNSFNQNNPMNSPPYAVTFNSGYNYFTAYGP
jgi:hypothetical protein